MELLEQILSNKNMNEAYIRVYKNKGASGIDGVNSRRTIAIPEREQR
jgi:2-succinyl-5-enolpyruvyl-6-hydroxy-3-cyclohexene-1-carboxylate synthase